MCEVSHLVPLLRIETLSTFLFPCTYIARGRLIVEKKSRFFFTFINFSTKIILTGVIFQSKYSRFPGSKFSCNWETNLSFCIILNSFRDVQINRSILYKQCSIFFRYALHKNRCDIFSMLSISMHLLDILELNWWNIRDTSLLEFSELILKLKFWNNFDFFNVEISREITRTRTVYSRLLSLFFCVFVAKKFLLVFFSLELLSRKTKIVTNEFSGQ